MQAEISRDGFEIVNGIYAPAEIAAIGNLLKKQESSRPTFRRSTALFAVRQLLKEIPAAIPLIFTPALKRLIGDRAGKGYFLVKSIYFDKPPASNWFVAFHQDLTISVAEKAEATGFGPWTVKQDQYAVQPPVALLEDNITVRIHLDETDEQNGALHVVPGSHLSGIRRDCNQVQQSETVTCRVSSGGVMLMKPLLAHGTFRTSNEKGRRVIHLEFSRQELPAPLQWSERLVPVSTHRR
ncbi:phytanoyl-CoA dioxygenase family protein [Flavihumibacter petaseus]|uniref:Phytanoyl-CoA dioxygenase n=1 Tax=Flavihumibacter petaseus NBRC 106054 TaxID=1220578 RepID=A0A0E9N543_9BACT|nr:phytanoyl-CoA dioxygenase family protein [Flavihumibacter petaseus]GAO44913.1 hypothetical protein FPE01S_04_01560 [Flavihumibacter petaseus NBRC 106054]